MVVRFKAMGIFMGAGLVITPVLVLSGFAQPLDEAKSIVEICVQKGIFPVQASIIVLKERRKLFFYLDDRFVKVYPVVFGKNPNGQKRYEGDNCTPEGVFRIVSKRAHEKWSRFILLDYPTRDDVIRHQKACSDGLIPLRDGGCLGLGGGIGIHGTHSEAMNGADIDWTNGCISLLNHHIEELFPYVEAGNFVFIFP
jgi:murein L,D-transpeptidase YafK